MFLLPTKKVNDDTKLTITVLRACEHNVPFWDFINKPVQSCVRVLMLSKVESALGHTRRRLFVGPLLTLC